MQEAIRELHQYRVDSVKVVNERNKPEDERPGVTVKFILYNQKENKPLPDGGFEVEQITGCFTVNTYPDGTPCEVFIDTGKEGEVNHGWADSWAISISFLLQHGVAPQKIYDKFKNMDFKPNGMSNVPSATFCKSIPDMIVKYMESHFPPTAKVEEEGDSYDDILR